MGLVLGWLVVVAWAFEMGVSDGISLCEVVEALSVSNSGSFLSPELMLVSSSSQKTLISYPLTFPTLHLATSRLPHLHPPPPL